MERQIVLQKALPCLITLAISGDRCAARSSSSVMTLLIAAPEGDQLYTRFGLEIVIHVEPPTAQL